MKKDEVIKVILSIVLLIAYIIPLLISNNNVDDNYNYDFIDYIYSILTTLGIGGYLVADSYKLKKIHEHYLLSAGVFFVILSFIFIFDTLHDKTFRTYWYVVFNLLTTIICYFLLLYKKRFGRH
jgi:hypothetical protein